jgi:hypothetical protein
MTTIVTILTDGYAEWETALRYAVARSYSGVQTRFATPGTLALAGAGVLDGVRHTSNDAANLVPTGYRGETLYQEQPAAVVDGRIVTAAATAPVSFMAGVMQTLGLRDDNLDYYLAMHAAEHKAA